MVSERKRAKGPITARELRAELANDPAYQAMIRAKEEERLRLVEETRQAELPVLDALRQAGCEVERVGYLERTGEPFPEAIPILLEWLPRITHENARRNIISTLRQKWARHEVVPALLEEFRRAEGEAGLRSEIAGAIE